MIRACAMPLYATGGPGGHPRGGVFPLRKVRRRALDGDLATQTEAVLPNIRTGIVSSGRSRCVRILGGAPLSNKRENRGRGLFHALRRRSRQAGFGAANTDFVLGDLDLVHEQTRKGNGLHPRRATIDTARHVEDAAGDVRLLLLVDDEDFLVLVASPFLDFGLLTERRHRSVSQPLTSVLAHGAMHVLGVVARLVLIEDVEHLADELGAGILTDVLRDRDQLNAHLSELSHISFGADRIAAKAAERTNDDARKDRIRDDALLGRAQCDISERKTHLAPYWLP